jgi:hypothetical protein
MFRNDRRDDDRSTNVSSDAESTALLLDATASRANMNCTDFLE